MHARQLVPARRPGFDDVGWLDDARFEQTVMNQLVQIGRSMGSTDRVVPGIAVYNTSPANAAAKLKGAHALGYPMLALYSYDSLFALKRGWTRLEQGLDEPRAGD